MDINKARRKDVSLGIHYCRGPAGRLAPHAHDVTIFDGHLGPKPGIARAVHNAGVRDKHIVGFKRRGHWRFFSGAFSGAVSAVLRHSPVAGYKPPDNQPPQASLRPDHVSSSMGSFRIRFPVRANRALQTAGATGGSAGSPAPDGDSLLGMRWTSTRGISAIRNSG